jgi:hypothetical protein
MTQVTKAASVLFCCAIGLVGCGTADENSSASSSTASTANTTTTRPWPKDVPDEVLKRTSLPDCGQYQPGSTADLVADAQRSLDCFMTAYASGQSAEVRIIVPTIDTEPVPTIFRTYSDGKRETIEIRGSTSAITKNCKTFSIIDPRYPECQ